MRAYLLALYVLVRAVLPMPDGAPAGAACDERLSMLLGGVAQRVAVAPLAQAVSPIVALPRAHDGDAAA